MRVNKTGRGKILSWAYAMIQGARGPLGSWLCRGRKGPRTSDVRSQANGLEAKPLLGGVASMYAQLKIFPEVTGTR